LEGVYRVSNEHRRTFDEFHNEHRGAKVVVLYGPRSRADSLYLAEAPREQLSVTAITESLSRLGFEWQVISPLRPNLPGALAGVDFVFVNLHGEWGEDGRVQGFLDYLGVPYTGSGVAASAVCADKLLFKRLVGAYGYRTPQFWESSAALKPGVEFPLLIKPVYGGSSIGLRIVRNIEEADHLWEEATADPDWPVFLEQFLEARSLTLGLLEIDEGRLGRLPLVEIQPPGVLYDKEAKLDETAVSYTVPAEVSGHVEKTIGAAVVSICQRLAVRGFARVDLLLNGADNFDVLEANTIPGLSVGSNFATACQACGLTYDEMILALLRSSRWKGPHPNSTAPSR
jgi:D-alanine-D-alanine ligase